MDWSYIAGYFDGEGHVSMHRQAKTGRSKIRALSWYNTHHESLIAMQAFMGVGRITKQDKINRNKPLYTLIISRRQHLIQVLDNLIPLLLVKRDEAQVLRNELDTMRDESPGHGAAVRASTEDLMRWYHDEGKSYSEIGKMLGIGGSAIAREFRTRKLPRRPGGGSFMHNQPKSEETKKRMREARRKMWEDPEFRISQIANMQRGRREKRAIIDTSNA